MSPSPLEEAYGRSERVVGRRIGDELVLIPLAGQGADLDHVRTLNPVAAFIWEQLDGTRTGAEVVASMVARFEVQRPEAEADYLELLETLRALEAVRPVGEDRR